MQNKIVKLKPTRRRRSFDGIILKQKPRVVAIRPVVAQNLIFHQPSWLRLAVPGRGQWSAVLTATLLFVGFLGGFWFTWQTKPSGAEGQVLGVTDISLSPTETTTTQTSTSSPETMAQLSDDGFLKLTVSQIEAYLEQVVKTPQLKEAERLADRKKKLKIYLQEKGSPFADIADTIAELPHWKMVLAISNSESTMGKRCYNNNCSGIGVAPGHPLWRDYPSHKEWAKDLDRLLEKRYKNWTLEQMNGVYNQPGSRNWVLASKQVLEELQDRGIE